MSNPPGPRFSVVMPAHDTPAELLRLAIDSVRDQTFDDWELVVVDDGSTSTAVADVAGRAADADDRVRLLRHPANQGIVAATNTALAAATGSYVALMDHDDLLEPTALTECDNALRADPTCDLLYTDEDWIDMEGRRLGPFLKPDWSPERLRAQMYVNHLTVYRRRLIDEIGGFRPGFDGSQDYDLVLRASERTTRIVHLPRILYHWRVRPGQVSGTGNPAVYAAARRAIAEHCDRVGIPADVEQIDAGGIYRLHRRIDGAPLVSIVIPTRGSTGTIFGRHRSYVMDAIRSIVACSTYPNLEIVVVADTTTPHHVESDLATICGDRAQLRFLWYHGPFNYARKMDTGVVGSTGSYLLLLNDDIEVISPDWVETLLGLAQQPDIGMVGATLLFEDGTVQHAGHLYPGGGAIGHVGYGVAADDPGPVSVLTMDRECSGVTAACAMMRRDVYLDVGGLSPRFPMNYNDVDLSLKVRGAGLRIVCTPFARLYHFESKSRRSGIGAAELELIKRRWGRVLDHGDPYWRHGSDGSLVTDPSEAEAEAELADALERPAARSRPAR